MERLTKTQYFLILTRVLSLRASCSRRKVGCVLIDDKSHILSTGYNGTPAGMPNCIGGHKCAGANFPSGEGLNACQAIHAEQNALLQCPDVYRIEKAFVTTSPCITCTKLLLNTSCKEIIFLEEYPGEEAKNLWEMSGRKWTKNSEDLSEVHSFVKDFALID